MSMNERVLAPLVVSCALLSATGCDADDRERSPAPGPLPAATSLAPLAESTGVTFPEWGIPIAPGTRVWSYPTVTVEERYGKAITIDPDLVVGGDSADPGPLFYRPSDAAVDREGRMYVLDQGANRVEVFAPDGTFLRSIGAEGQGPG